MKGEREKLPIMMVRMFVGTLTYPDSATALIVARLPLIPAFGTSCVMYF